MDDEGVLRKVLELVVEGILEKLSKLGLEETVLL